MKYLAFDIEAANGFNPASVCSVGIVIADENFEILRKENLWINPRSKYNLNGTRPNVGIDLHLDKKLLEKSPDFKGRYDEIKSLLTAPDTIVLGHAVDSDVRMLNAATKKYNLPCINFEFICSQLLYKCFKGDVNVKGLDKIADELGIKFQQHYSDEDALMSMLTLKFLCFTTNLTVDGLLKEYNVRRGQNKDFEITRPVSLTGQLSKKNITKSAIEKIKKKISQLNKEKIKKGQKLKGKTVALSRDLEVAEESVWAPVVEKIVREGGEYTAKAGKCDFYVKFNEISESSANRERYLKMRTDRGDAVQLLTMEEFLKI